MSKSQFVGVDGCPDGWFSVGLDNCDGYEVRAFKTFCELLVHYGEARLVLADIPIGLLEGGPDERACEPRAREVLRDRGRSVFPVPPRELVRKMVENKMNHACTNELSKSSRGKGIALQTYYIMDKIAEVDEVLSKRCREAPPWVREVHPEICFWALNRSNAMCHAKKTKGGKGIKERIEVLKRCEPRTDNIYNCAFRKYRRKQVARDDILDALAAAVTAKLGWPDKLQTLPECPPTDSNGLPMEMVYVVQT